MNIKKGLPIAAAGPMGFQRTPRATVTAHAAS